MTGIEHDDRHFTAWPIEAIGPERSFLAYSHAWSVRETIDPITHARVLIFTSTGVGRRVRTYPANWRDLSAEELTALSESK